jgi:hypothetical protein
MPTKNIPSIDDLFENARYKTGLLLGTYANTAPVDHLDLTTENLLTLGFNTRLSRRHLTTMMQVVRLGCTRYSETMELPVGLPDGSEADRIALSESQNAIGPETPTIPNPVEERIWQSILHNMHSGLIRSEACWRFARALAALPSHRQVICDIRLLRLIAVRLAVTGYSRELSIAANVELLILLYEFMADAVFYDLHRRRIWRLCEATSADLVASALAYSKHDHLKQTKSGVAWEKSVLIWLNRVEAGVRLRHLPPDRFLTSATAVLTDVMATHELTQPKAEKSQSNAIDGQPPSNKFFFDKEVLPETAADQSLTLKIMESIDLLKYGDEERRKYVGKYLILTSPLPLKMLPPPAETNRALNALMDTMPNFAPVIRSLQGDFALAQRGATPAALHIRPSLILGPPAIGKTRFAFQLAKSLGAEPCYLAVGGDADNRRFSGTAHGFSTGHSSWPVEQVTRLAQANPVLIVDEIEKAGGSKSNGILMDSILALLEPASASQFSDPFLGGPINLSAVSWIFMANSRGDLSEPLLSRLNVFSIEPPPPDAFDQIVNVMLNEIAADHHVDTNDMPSLPPTFLADLRATYARLRDLRRVRRTLETAFGILARYDDQHSQKTLN